MKLPDIMLLAFLMVMPITIKYLSPKKIRLKWPLDVPVSLVYLSGLKLSKTPILRLKNKAEFTWGAEQQEAFEKIKKYLSSPPVLKEPKRGIPFRLYVAAEDKVIGVVLTQETEGKEYVITYVGR